MAFRLWDTESTGPNGLLSGADHNESLKFLYNWTDAALSAGAITLPGDGKYRATYSGAQNLDTINGTSSGDIGKIAADVGGAGAPLTIRHNVGNILTNAGVDIVLASKYEYADWCHIDDKILVSKQYGAA